MNEIVKELMPLLQKVADKLDSSAQYLWQLQLQQAHIAAWTYLIKYSLWTVGLICYLATIYFTAKQKEDVEEFVVGMLLAGGAVGALLYFFWLPEITSMMTVIYNPEYWALNEIIKMVK